MARATQTPTAAGTGRWAHLPGASATLGIDGIDAQQAPTYRQPWHSVLYQVVRDNLATLYQASEDGFGTPLPQFVRDQLEGYLGCQVLGRGFAHMVCKDCAKPELVAFCCRGRGYAE